MSDIPCVITGDFNIHLLHKTKKLEVVLKRNTLFQQSNFDFDVPDQKTVGKFEIQLHEFDKGADYNRVTVKYLR